MVGIKYIALNMSCARLSTNQSFPASMMLLRLLLSFLFSVDDALSFFVSIPFYNFCFLFSFFQDRAPSSEVEK
jgi:hypothetical protein